MNASAIGWSNCMHAEEYFRTEQNIDFKMLMLVLSWLDLYYSHVRTVIPGADARHQRIYRHALAI